MPTIGLTVEEIGQFQFVDSPIAVNVQLTDLATNTVKTGETLFLKVLLSFEACASQERHCLEHHPNLLEIIQNEGIKENGKAQILVKVKDPSRQHDNQRFVLHIEGYRPQGDVNVIAAVTSPFTVIRHKLKIFEAHNEPYTWFKDEGSKDKCIKVIVKLIDSKKNQVTSREVPLLVSLIYSSGQPVPASVLTIFRDNDKPLSIGLNGAILIRFRVNEVSRNHRKQMFHLLVAPDTALRPEVGDISPATSVAFEVKSKRSAEARREPMAGNDDSSDTCNAYAPSGESQAAFTQAAKRARFSEMSSPSLNSFRAPSSGRPPPLLTSDGIGEAGSLRVPSNPLLEHLAAGLAGASVRVEQRLYESPLRTVHMISEWTEQAVRAIFAVSKFLQDSSEIDVDRRDLLVQQCQQVLASHSSTRLKSLTQMIEMQEQTATEHQLLLSAMASVQQKHSQQVNLLDWEEPHEAQ